MPDIITHVLFGQDMIKEISNDKWYKTIVKNKSLFVLGCQGPDIFFYNDFLPWMKDKRGPKIGKMMHNKKTGDFLIESLRFIKNSTHQSKDKEIMLTYLLGFMCHFALDRKTHPFIFYFSGEYDANRPDTFKYKGYHKRLEVVIDTILLLEKEGKASYKYSVVDKIDIGDEMPKAVTKLYDNAFKKVYSIETDRNLVNDSYKDMKRVFKLLYDPIGVKKILLNSLDVLTKGSVKYSELTYPKKVDCKTDYMNKKKGKWCHPCNKNEVYNHSFYDLYKKALDLGKRMIISSIAYIENEISEEEMMDYFPNVSYSTDKIGDESTLKYFSPIFD